jgi:hypothetical protein
MQSVEIRNIRFSREAYGSVHISYPVLSALRGLTALGIFNGEDCQFVSGLTQLRRLELEYIRIMPDINALTGLTSLKLQMSFRDPSICDIGALVNLQHLHISDATFQARMLIGMSKLTELRICSCVVKGDPVCDFLENLTRLQTLHVIQSTAEDVDGDILTIRSETLLSLTSLTNLAVVESYVGVPAGMSLMQLCVTLTDQDMIVDLPASLTYLDLGVHSRRFAEDNDDAQLLYEENARRNLRGFSGLNRLHELTIWEGALCFDQLRQAALSTVEILRLYGFPPLIHEDGDRLSTCRSLFAMNNLKEVYVMP